MDDEERYLFDLQGYLVIENALSAETVAAMNAWIDAQAEQDPKWRGQPGNDKLQNVLTWGPEFLALLDHPRLLPMFKAILGSHLRFDHDYAIFLQPGGEGLFLHGGGTPYDPSQYYHVIKDRIYSGLAVAVYALNDVPPGSGGFACIPGSHKSNFRCPEDIMMLRRPSPIVQQIPVKAGDCILFTEALQHGTLPWQGPHTRRTLYLKYAPAHLRWGPHHYEPGNPVYEQIAPHLSECQRLLLQPALIEGHQRIP
ncbi:MAG TPA: phytanoyl-CoA dioxygenase family protein [Chthonomonadaceae bacterium]|nr:phytanoyl-CoA dioxygenase family protein [Chthonomonadaceae bacterium]